MKVCTFGECLIDFTPVGLSDQGNIMFERNPGGAPANVAVQLARLGVNAKFIGKVGNDLFGDFLKATLRKEGVDISSMVTSSRYKTTLAFVQLDEKGERSFCFYRNPGADITMESRDVDFNTLQDCSVFHFGSVSLTHNPVRTATLEAAKYARKRGCLISYDPNLRLPLWNSAKDAKETILNAMELCDILKISDEELAFLAPGYHEEEGVRMLQKRYHLSLVMLTKGAKGCAALAKDEWIEASGMKAECVDTTGAGDAFFGGFLAEFVRRDKPLADLNKEELLAMMRFANACGAIAVRSKGAIPSLARRKEVEAFLNQQKADEYA